MSLEPPSIDPAHLHFLAQSTMSLGLIIAFIIMGALLLCSALISGSEVAYFSLSPAEMEEIEESKSSSSKRILSLVENPQKLLATILVANNFLNVGIIILSTYIMDGILPVDMPSIEKFLWQTVLVTFIILLLGEVVPKVYATKSGLRLARIMSLPITLMESPWIFGSIGNVLIRSTNVIEKRIKKRDANVSVDSLEHALELTNDQNTTEEERKILQGIVRFGNTDVKQIMKPRTDVVAFDIETNYDELLKEIVKAGHSRVPVYRESFDHIEGILYIKDLLPHFDQSASFEWQTLIRKPFIVPRSKKIDDLLAEFQEKKIHLAIVVDEYGGTQGIVTLEDILEEIVGEITDEFDDDNLAYSKLDENNYVFEGKTPLNDVYRALDIEGKEFEDAKGESDTLAGFILELFGKIPQKNEKINFEHYVFTVEAADRRRVKQVKITIKQNANS